MPIVAIPEINPYRPDVPTEFRDINPLLYEFLRETQETLRFQHNLIQAGDSTYHWSIATKVTTNRLFTLGSLSRFYHESYGIIVCRYVQFKQMIDDDWLGVPVGRPNASVEFDWTVTNDLSKSNSNAVCGFTASLETMVNDSYGWIIVSGTNLYSIQLDQAEPASRGDELVWSGSLEAKTGVSGRIFGRIVATPTTVNLSPGQVFIELESFSPAFMMEIVSAEFQPQINALDLRLSSLETQVENIIVAIENSNVTALTLRVTTLESNLAKEVTARQNADNKIRSDFATTLQSYTSDTDLANFHTLITNEYVAADNELRILINQAQTRADQAYDLASSIAGGSVDMRLDALEYLVGQHGLRLTEAEKIYLPLVNGEVPPVLMYLDDGRLIYVEVI